MAKQVGFRALIKKIEIKSLVSGDKGLTIVLQVDSPDPDLLNGLNALHRADAEVGVAIVENRE